MKEHDVNLTLQETEQLCRLYMDCRLSVLEETELQYILGELPYSSPCIDEVRMLMGISITMNTKEHSKKRSGWFNRRTAIGIAASVAILFTVGVACFLHIPASPHSSLSNDNDPVYITAYRHGKRLTGSEAFAVTNMASAKADSLMKYAALTERDYILKANDIITTTNK